MASNTFLQFLLLIVGVAFDSVCVYVCVSNASWRRLATDEAIEVVVITLHNLHYIES